MSRDQVNRFLRNSLFLRNQLRNLISPLLQDLPTAFLFVDDSVQDKRYSRFIEGAKRQYPGAAHGLVMDICLVNPAHRSGPATFCRSITACMRPGKMA